MTAAELAAESLDVAEQLELPHMTCSALLGCASAALILGNAMRARELAVRGAALAERSSDPPYVVLHKALLGSLDLALGEYAAAASRLRPLLSRLNVLGVRPATQSIWADTMEALTAVGELDEAAKVAADLERSAQEPTTAAVAARCAGILAAAHETPTVHWLSSPALCGCMTRYHRSPWTGGERWSRWASFGGG